MTATQTTKKKTTRKAPPKKFTQKDLDKMLSEQKEELTNQYDADFEDRIKSQLEERETQTDFGEEPAPLNSLFEPEDDESTPDILLGQEQEFDIFEFGEGSVKSGVFVKYYVTRDGEFIGAFDNPCSYQYLQKMYGGGHYKVVCKDRVNKRYMKSQVQMVAALPEKETTETPQTQYIPQPQQQLDPTKMLAPLLDFVNQANAQSSRDKGRDEREDKRSSELQQSSFTQMITSQQTASQQMFEQMQRQNMDSQKNTNDLMMKMQENTNKLIEKMNEKNEKQIEKFHEALSKKKEDMTPMELFTMMIKFKSEGKEEMKEIFELVEARAADKADEDGDGSGLLGKLVPSVVALMNAQSQTRPMQGHPQQQPRRVVQPPVQQQTRNPQSRPSQERTSEVPQDRGGYRGNPERSVGSSSISSLIKEGSEEESSDAPVVHQQGETVSVVENEEAQNLDSLFNEASEEQQTIAKIAILKIIEVMEGSPAEAALVVSQELEEKGWTQNQVLEHFKFEFLWKVAKAFDINDNKRTWFEEFYAYIENPAGMDVEREQESTESAGL